VPTIDHQLQIPDSEIAFRYSRSSGPGGQNVNKVATRVTLLFDVRSSPSLSEEQRRRIEHVTSQRHRSRAANQRDALARFQRLVADALRERLERVETRIPRRQRRLRLRAKKHRGRIKELRSRPSPDED
jgi:ribosome-associated protein